MTDEEWIDLGRRAMACRGWRWLPGMLAYRPGGIWEWRRHSVAKWTDSLGVRRSIPGCAVPDLRDPATLGCLLALVREAWGGKIGGADRYKVPDGDPGLWGIHVWTADSSVARRFTAATEAAALVAALESAPEHTR